MSVALCSRDHCDLEAPHGRLCPTHRGHLANDLAALPSLIRELETTVTGQATTHHGFDWNASIDARAVGETLRVWCRDLAKTRVTGPRPAVLVDHEGPVCADNATRPDARGRKAGCGHQSCGRIRRDRTAKPLDRATYWAAWLHAHLDVIDRQPWAGQFADEIEFATRSARRAVDARVPQVHLADCWADIPDPDAEHGGVITCGTPLRARAGQQIITCERCGTHYDVDERRSGLLQVAEDALMTAPEIARALPDAYQVEVSYATLRKWIQRGRVAERGVVTVDGRARATYRVGDVLDLLRSRAAA